MRARMLGARGRVVQNGNGVALMFLLTRAVYLSRVAELCKWHLSGSHVHHGRNLMDRSFYQVHVHVHL